MLGVLVDRDWGGRSFSAKNGTNPVQSRPGWRLREGSGEGFLAVSPLVLPLPGKQGGERSFAAVHIKVRSGCSKES